MPNRVIEISELENGVREGRRECSRDPIIDSSLLPPKERLLMALFVETRRRRNVGTLKLRYVIFSEIRR